MVAADEQLEDEKNLGHAALELAPSVRQEQILAPQLRACLRVLQMDLPTLVAEVRHEAEVNPVVEVETPDSMTTVSEELRSAERSEERTDESPVDDDSNPSVNIDEDAAERRQRFFDSQVASESLQEHLMVQVGAAGFSRNDRQLAELIIGDIDDDGRYVGSLEELSSVMGVSMAKLTEVLKQVQTFDPPGVGGRNLRECLEIQVVQLEVESSVRQLMLQIVGGQLSQVARKDIDGIATELGVDKQACEQAIRILKTLEPKPGRQFVPSGRQVQFIRPELEAEVGASGISLSSCEHELPTLTINPEYRTMAEDPNTPNDTRAYLRERIGSAELLQDAIRRRGETVLKVAEAVFSEQFEFFQHGFESLRPLTIEEVAKRTGFHGTTVGRAVRGKYIRTPRGVYELSRFFCVGKLSGEGDSLVSAVAVKCRLSSLIKAEHDEVLTDDDLAKALSGEGTRISRRTVSKYRAELGIPSAAERKKRSRIS